MAVEVDGSAHFTQNEPFVPLGRTLWRWRLLASRGWKVRLPACALLHARQHGTKRAACHADRFRAHHRPVAWLTGLLLAPKRCLLSSPSLPPFPLHTGRVCALLPVGPAEVA